MSFAAARAIDLDDLLVMGRCATAIPPIPRRHATPQVLRIIAQRCAHRTRDPARQPPQLVARRRHHERTAAQPRRQLAAIVNRAHYATTLNASYIVALPHHRTFGFARSTRYTTRIPPSATRSRARTSRTYPTRARPAAQAPSSTPASSTASRSSEQRASPERDRSPLDRLTRQQRADRRQMCVERLIDNPNAAAFPPQRLRVTAPSAASRNTANAPQPNPPVPVAAGT